MAKKSKAKSSAAKSKKRKALKSKSPTKAKKQSATKKGKQPKPKTRKKAAKKARPPRPLRADTMPFFPPHKCERTPSGCLKFYPDKDGAYVRPRGGELVDCAECQYWF